MSETIRRRAPAAARPAARTIRPPVAGRFERGRLERGGLGALDPQVRAWHAFEQITCGLTLALIGWRGTFHFQTSYGEVIALALIPVWLSATRKFRGGMVVIVGGLLALINGCVLAATAGSQGRTTSLNQFLIDSGVVLVTLTGIGVLLWARTIMSRRSAALFFGVGLLVRGMQTGLHTDNPWKFAFTVPVAVLVLAVTDHLRRPRWTLLALLALGLASGFTDARSLFATFLLAAILVVYQLRPTRMGKPASWVWTAAAGIGLAGAIYNLASALLVDGYFGPVAQRRSIAQIQSSGSLILGGRPEIAATKALMQHDPFGFGFGVAPNASDIAAAKTGMISINYYPENNYVNQYMFGGHVELHSTVGDLWAHAGVFGLLLVVIICLLAARNLADSMHRREASGLIMFLTCFTGWNLFFSPESSAIPTLTLTLGLGMIALPEALSSLHLAAEGMTTRPGVVRVTQRPVRPDR